MPKLQTFNATDVFLRPPKQLIGYTQLRHLGLSWHAFTHPEVELPGWFSQLTQLEVLVLQAQFSTFPSCLLQLKQLQSLHLRGCGLIYTPLPESILDFADFSALTRLDLSCYAALEPPKLIPSNTNHLLGRLKQVLRPGVEILKVSFVTAVFATSTFLSLYLLALNQWCNYTCVLNWPIWIA